MLRGVWRRMRRLLEQNRVFVPVLAVVVLALVFVLSRLLTVPPIFTPQTGPAFTPAPTQRTPEPLTGPAPNVVLILTDDQRWDSMRVMPNVQRLIADHGMTFRNAFASTPICCPSRATILTGQHTYHTRVVDNSGKGGGVQAFRQRSTLATWLKKAGYNTSYVGKYLNGYEKFGELSYVPAGWDDWHALVGVPRGGAYFDFGMNENGEISRYGNAPSDYQTDVLARRAVEFIARAQRPFFLHFATLAPHIPSHPAPQDVAAFDDEPLFRPPSYNVRARDDTPAGALPPLPPRVADIADTYWKRGLASLLAVDRAVATIVDAVESRGELDNTIFIFMSDNGFLFGEHRLIGAAWPYEPSIRVPLLIRLPGERASTSDRLVLNADIAPTIVELAGAKADLRPDGTSLVPLLRGNEEGWREEIPIMYLGSGDRPYSPPRFFAVRTDRYKLVLYQDNSRELFDLQNDPDEVTNLSGRPDMYEIEDPLFQRIARLTPKGYLEGRRKLPRPTPDPNPDPNEVFED